MLAVFLSGGHSLFCYRLVLPLVIRETVSLIRVGTTEDETVDMSTYGFLYGTFPAAPGVFVFATQYGVDVDLVRFYTKVYLIEITNLQPIA